MDYHLQGKIADLPDIDGSYRKTAGKYIHLFVQDLFTQAFGLDFTSIEEEVRLYHTVRHGDTEETFVFTGHPDGVLQSYGLVVEIKSVSANSFYVLSSRDEPYQQHIDQASLYARALDMKGILFVYYNRDTGEYRIMVRPVGNTSATLEKMVAAEFRRRRGEMIDRPYYDQSSAPCSFCPAAEDCYKGFSVDGFEERRLDIDGECALWDKTRMARLSFESEEKELKDAVIKKMMEAGIKLAEGEEYVAAMRIGKNNNPLLDIKRRIK